jgi:hypothetical protein
VNLSTSNGGRLRTDFAAGKAALETLGAAWPVRMSLPDLVTAVNERLANAGCPVDESTEARVQLCGFLLELFRGGIVMLHTWTPEFTRMISDRPLASGLTRWQAKRQETVTSPFHTGIQIEDESGRHLLSILDGTRERAALSADMFEFFRAKGALKDDAFDEAELRRRVDEDLEKNLGKLARLGLLVG